MRRLIFVLILANFVLYLIIFSALKEGSLVAFLNIGQGEGVLFKDKKNVFLYDTGKYPNLTIKEIDKNLPFYNRKIDILFLESSVSFSGGISSFKEISFGNFGKLIPLSNSFISR